MIDAFYIFTKGGLLLWSYQMVKIKGNPLDQLIKQVLLEERVGDDSASFEPYNMKWRLLNDLDVFFVAVYQGILQLSYLETLLKATEKEFVSRVSGSFGDGLQVKSVDFGPVFTAVMQKCDEAAKEAKRGRPMKSFEETKKGKELQKSKGEEVLSQGKAKKGGGRGKENEDDGEEDDEDENGESDETNGKADAGVAVDVDLIAESRKKLFAKGKAGGKKKASEPPKKEEEEESKKKSGKAARDWAGQGKLTKEKMEALDFSSRKADADGEDEALRKARAEYLEGAEDMDIEGAEVASLSSDDEGAADTKKKDGGASGLFNRLNNGLKNLTGGAVLTKDDLEPLLEGFRKGLMEKNVATDVTYSLSESVIKSLVGKKTEKFTSMGATVKKSLMDAMENLLTPKKSVDVLRAALAARDAGRVYTIVFLGVNGVGKSTNLAKVAYFLKHKGGLNPLICACDTFRAGAVEQLRTHSRCLDVPLFERGYGKDPADIAKHGILHASQNGFDVVLVDTAGRMQDNEPLMRALAKLVAVNTPDLVLFVGEALVGNDAIDQVTKFNRSLIDMCPDKRNPRGIDGMLLTKYDTVDDKVGAALSMVYVTGQPVVFVGCGQKYTHLRKLQVKEVCRTLLG